MNKEITIASLEELELLTFGYLSEFYVYKLFVFIFLT